MSSGSSDIEVIVLGAGVIGLTVAHVLSENGQYKIKVVARDTHQDLDSQGFSSPWAGANWSPMGKLSERTYGWEKATFNKLWDMIPSGLVLASPSKVFYEEGVDVNDLWYKDLVRDFRVLDSSELPATQKRGVGFQTVSVCPDHYLPWLAKELQSRGVEFVRRKVASIGEAAALAGPNGVLVNATGLGARSLIGLEDKDVYPIRGQTVVIDNPNVREFRMEESIGSGRPMAADGNVTYIIPRPWPNASGFTTILGGKYQEGNWDTSFSAADAQGILDRCAKLVPAIKDKDTKILKHNVGLRPARKGGPRVEAEWLEIPCKTEWITTGEDSASAAATGKVLVVHAYGFGSAGYQMSWGAAEDVGSLVNSGLNLSNKMPGRFDVFLLGLLTIASAAQLSNRTIDDEYGDSVTGTLPDYFGPWVEGAQCRCSIRLDTTNLFRGTWHGIATSSNEDRIPTITLRFTGVAIYVYNVLANSVLSANFATGTRLAFTLDDAPDGHFQHNPTSSTQFLFNRLVYSHTGLVNAEHVLVIQSDAGSLCMFDYALFTFSNEGEPAIVKVFHWTDTEPCLPSQLQGEQRSTPPLGAILGGSIGGAAAVIVLLAALLVYLRAKRRTVWSWLPPCDGTTETRDARNIPSREISEDILHIAPAWSRPFDNRPRIPSSGISLPQTEDTEHRIEVVRDSRFSFPFLFFPQRASSRGLTAPAECIGREAVASPHTSVQVVIDGKLQPSDIGRDIVEPASTPSDTIRWSFSSTSTVVSTTETVLNEEVMSQLASLRAEVAGLRAQQEVQRRLIEAPPRYGEGM
ncbi:hypothetical protein V8D89_010445 [Ganoderma adspersum]